MKKKQTIPTDFILPERLAGHLVIEFVPLFAYMNHATKLKISQTYLDFVNKILMPEIKQYFTSQI